MLYTHNVCLNRKHISYIEDQNFSEEYTPTLTQLYNFLAAFRFKFVFKRVGLKRGASKKVLNAFVFF